MWAIKQSYLPWRSVGSCQILKKTKQMRATMLDAIMALSFAMSAHARDGHFYIGGDLGLILAADSDLDFVPGGVRSIGSANLNFKTVFDGGIFAGYDLGTGVTSLRILGCRTK